MPELPEVETILRGISPQVIHQKIISIDVNDTRLRWPVQTNALHKWLVGQTIVGIKRRSKYMLLEMQNGAYLVIHLGMTGRLGVFQPGVELEKHTHIVFHFAKFQMRFRDPRRFGFVEIIEPDGLAHYPRFDNLGVEPLTNDFSSDHLFQFTQKSAKPIKNLIMDAKIVVGVGNIYANESLFGARIHPQMPACDLRKEQIVELTREIKDTLERALQKGGTTLNDYRNASGEPGYFQLDLKVYGRTDEPCFVCGSTIEKVVLAGRSSFYCPKCQKS